MKHTDCSLALAVLLVLFTAACSGSSGSASAPPTPGPTPPPSPQISLQEAFPNLSFTQPVAMVQAPGDATRWYVTQRAGSIITFENDPAVASASFFASIQARVVSSGEGGLLSMAFAPDYANNRAVFLAYTGGSPFESRIASFLANPDGLTLDDASETIILRQSEPFSNHNIGNLAFGPGPAADDQYLYAGFGDGGSGGDPNDNAQNPFNFLGTILRLDVSPITGYSIPPDNPFADGANAAPEVFAFGFRNPWRFSFDKTNGTLWAADVGQSSFEEVNIVTAGGNYGWRCYEGNSVFNGSNCPPQDDLTFPVAVYSHPVGGASVTGGFVYRGAAVSGLQGVYVFGDFVSGTIWGLFPESANQFRMEVLLESGLNIVSFAEDHSGELLVVDFAGGIFRIVNGG